MTYFDQLIGEFLEETWNHDPVMATRLGIHRYDPYLADKSPEAMEAWGKRLAAWQACFKETDEATLTLTQRCDRRWALAILDYALVNRERRLWQRMPQQWVDEIGSALHSLLVSQVVPFPERIDSLLTRLRAIPAFLQMACQSLVPELIPAIWLQQALPNARDTQRFIAQDVPKVVTEGAASDDLERACLKAAQAVEEFETFLRNQQGRANGQYAIGRELFDRILNRFHMLDMDSQALYDFGLEWIDRYERQLETVARQIDPSRHWAEILELIKDDHPEPQALRDAYDQETRLARQHCLEQDLISFPEGEICMLEWTPVFMRARTPIAQPWVSPPFEPGLVSRWYITPIDPEAPYERQRQHLRDNSWAWIRSIAMHEIYPGHHLQLVIAKQVATPLRKQFWSPVFGEGWGLYTEELFYETGFLAEPRLRLMQLRNALWRAVRIIVDTGLHTRNMSVQESVSWLSGRARLEPRWAESETCYYTTQPTYPSSYQVGYVMLLKLRERYKARKGNSFQLKAFHDELMTYGSLPLKMVEEEMLAVANLSPYLPV